MTTQREPGAIPAPIHLNQDFSVSVANQKWVCDFTYVDTLDLFSRKVVGWAMAERMNTDLVESVLHMA